MKGQAFPFKEERGAKTETRGYLPGKKFADEVGEKTEGIPIGFKIAASHIEAEIDTFVTEGKTISNPKLTKITSANSHV